YFEPKLRPLWASDWAILHRPPGRPARIDGPMARVERRKLSDREQAGSERIRSSKVLRGHLSPSRSPETARGKARCSELCAECSCGRGSAEASVYQLPGSPA